MSWNETNERMIKETRKCIKLNDFSNVINEIPFIKFNAILSFKNKF